MRIAIIGGGILGLTAAYYLTKENQEIYLFEKEEELGGLSSFFDYQGIVMEKYHHFVSQSDNYLNSLLSELGIKDQLFYNDTQVGYFINNQLIPFTTPLQILKFPNLPLLGKLRLGLSMYSLKLIKNWQKLEKISAKKWLIKYQGKEVYEKIWEHLIESKFKDYIDQTPMSWLWSRSVRRLANRSQSASTERFGYMKNSFDYLIKKLEKELNIGRVKIFKNCEVKEIINRRIAKKIITPRGSFFFDKIIVTIPLPIFSKITQNLPDKYRKEIGSIFYKSILNAVILTKQKLSQYFWLNISDRNIPFPGIIEFGNLKSKHLTCGLNVVYIPNYLSEDNSFYRLRDEEVKKIYVAALKRIYPNFKEDKLEKILIFKDQFADPLYSLNYSKKLPDFKTPVNNLFLCNTSQIYPETRSVNNSIKFGKKIIEIVLNNS